MTKKKIDGYAARRATDAIQINATLASKRINEIIKSNKFRSNDLLEVQLMCLEITEELDKLKKIIRGNL